MAVPARSTGIRSLIWAYMMPPELLKKPEPKNNSHRSPVNWENRNMRQAMGKRIFRLTESGIIPSLTLWKQGPINSGLAAEFIDLRQNSIRFRGSQSTDDFRRLA